MKLTKWWIGGLVGLVFLLTSSLLYPQKLKLGYVNSQKVLSTYKEALDAQKKLDELNVQWEQEAREMQKQFQELSDQLESQSLLLSEERKAEKQQELQNLYIEFQQFQQEKWGPQGEAFKKQEELLKPIHDKIIEVIAKIGKEEGFDYIFDIVAANILYTSDDQPDLTDKVLEVLNKGVVVKSEEGKP